MGDEDTRHWRWLAHPVTVLALLVLILNDHVWKTRQPGLVTGKLSDAAGLVLMPSCSVWGSGWCGSRSGGASRSVE
jgi:hypothetical protein